MGQELNVAGDAMARGSRITRGLFVFLSYQGSSKVTAGHAGNNKVKGFMPTINQLVRKGRELQKLRPTSCSSYRASSRRPFLNRYYLAPSRKSRWNSLLGTLCGYAFLNRRGDNNTFDMHSLVHLAARIWVHREGRTANSNEKGDSISLDNLPKR